MIEELGSRQRGEASSISMLVLWAGEGRKKEYGFVLVKLCFSTVEGMGGWWYEGGREVVLLVREAQL